MNHGIVDVFAFQEAPLIEAAFGNAILTMIWAGFRRWLQHKDKEIQRIAEQTAERDARLERVEARLKAVEQSVPDAAVRGTAQIDTLATSPLPPVQPKQASPDSSSG